MAKNLNGDKIKIYTTYIHRICVCIAYTYINIFLISRRFFISVILYFFSLSLFLSRALSKLTLTLFFCVSLCEWTMVFVHVRIWVCVCISVFCLFFLSFFGRFLFARFVFAVLYCAVMCCAVLWCAVRQTVFGLLCYALSALLPFLHRFYYIRWHSHS